MTGWDDETGFKVVPKGWMLNLHLLGLIGVVDEVKTLNVWLAQVAYDLYCHDTTHRRLAINST